MRLDPADFPGLTPDQLAYLEKMAADAGREIRETARAPICPECRDGKHSNCIGYALDRATDTVTDCQCLHIEVA